MIWFFYTECILLPLILSLQIAALTTIHRNKNHRNKNQVYLMTVLCAGEIGYLIFGGFIVFVPNRSSHEILQVLRLIGFCICNVFLVGICYSAMTLFTIDRFMVFHLNIRYRMCCLAKNIWKLIAMISTISFLVLVIVVSLILIMKPDNDYVVKHLFIPSLIWDLIYIPLVVATYIYIFIVYRRQKKLPKTSNGNKESQFKLLVPTLIIMTFILFTILPDLYCAFIGSLNNEFSLSISVTLYSAGWIADSVIMIYDFKFSKVKKKFSRKRDTVSTEM